MKNVWKILIGIVLFCTMLYGISRLDYQIDPGECTMCGSCANSCPNNAIQADPELLTLRIDMDLCDGCGICLADCPHNAIYEADGRSFVFGRVWSSATNFAVSGAVVQIDSLTFTTDRFGEYSLTIGQGSFNLTCNATGFETFQQAVVLEADDAELVNILLTPSTGIQDSNVELIPASVNCYPNPSRAGINIEIKQIKGYSFPVTVEIFSLLGKRIRTMDSRLKLGKQTVYWDGFDESGRKASSGVYFCKVKEYDRVITTKLTILK